MKKKKMTEKMCPQCETLKHDFLKKSLADFLHTHIENVHLADFLLEYIQEIVVGLMNARDEIRRLIKGKKRRLILPKKLIDELVHIEGD